MSFSRSTFACTQQVVVDNRPGGNGSIGMAPAKAADRDGDTILFTQNAIMGNGLKS